MPDLSPKLGIKLPYGNENVSRSSFIENWSIIDAAVQKEISKGPVAPVSPMDHDLWLDTSVVPNVLKRYNASTWVVVSGKAFAKVRVGSTDIVADHEAGTIELTAGSGIVLTPDAGTDKINIAVNNSDFETPIGAQVKADNTRKDSSKELIVEVRTTDPVSPAIGRMWIRSDL